MMPNGDGTGNKINLGQLLNFNMREYARNLSAIPTQSEVVGKLVFHVHVCIGTVQISDVELTSKDIFFYNLRQIGATDGASGHGSSISEICTVSVYIQCLVFLSPLCN